MSPNIREPALANRPFLYWLGRVRGVGGVGVRIFIENPRRGGGSLGGGGAEGLGGCLRQIGELGGGVRGLNMFFQGRNVHQDGLVCQDGS